MREMRTFAKIFVHAVIVWLLAGAAVAGTFEDADAAHQRGDYETALRLLRPLAEQGDAGAQYYLGDKYRQGGGVTQDYVLAHMWLNLAATGGDQQLNNDIRELAVILRDLIAVQMTPDQIAEAQLLAREWKPNAK